MTDCIDGALARSLGMVSDLGGLLDPIADKVLLVATYACLTFMYYPFTLIPGWFLWLVILHEIILALGALYVNVIQKRGLIKPTILGKRTSFIQVLFMSWLLLCVWCGILPAGPYYSMLMLIICARVMVLWQYASYIHKGQQ